jgi:methyl acetate hydrolase
MSLPSEIDAVLHQAVAQGDVPGVVAAATERGGTIYEGGFGERALGSGTAMTTDTVGWIASMTKALTGTAAMQLVEQGRLELDRPAAEWVPELGAARVLEGFDDAGEPLSRPPRRAITLRHLLTHASRSSATSRPRASPASSPAGTPRSARRCCPTRRALGIRHQHRLGRQDGRGGERQAARRVHAGEHLRAARHGDTTFKVRPDMRARLAKVHQRGADGGFAPLDFEIPEEPEFEMGGGGLYGTVGDDLQFVRMILNRGGADGHQVLRPDTVDMMARNQMCESRVRGLKTAMPTLSNDAEFFPGMPKTWGSPS